MKTRAMLIAACCMMALGVVQAQGNTPEWKLKTPTATEYLNGLLDIFAQKPADLSQYYFSAINQVLFLRYPHLEKESSGTLLKVYTDRSAKIFTPRGFIGEAKRVAVGGPSGHGSSGCGVDPLRRSVRGSMRARKARASERQNKYGEVLREKRSHKTTPSGKLSANKTARRFVWPRIQ